MLNSCFQNPVAAIKPLTPGVLRHFLAPIAAPAAMAASNARAASEPTTALPVVVCIHGVSSATVGSTCVTL